MNGKILIFASGLIPPNRKVEMKEKLKKVYYCDFCKKHSLTSFSMKLHEKHCTLNPSRECRVCGNKEPVNQKDVKFIKNNDIELEKMEGGGNRILGTEKLEKAIKKLRQVYDCPVCIFSILRQAKIDLSLSGFHLDEEMREYWQKQNEEERY